MPIFLTGYATEIIYLYIISGSDVNEAFKLDEVADLNLPSDLPTTSRQHMHRK